MKGKSVIIYVVLLAVIVVFMVRFINAPKKFEYTFYPMGGIPCKIVEYDVFGDTGVKTAKAVEAKVDELEDIFNIHRADSEVSKLNLLQEDVWQKISPDMYKILEFSLAWYGRSGGAFDITVEPIITVWQKAVEAKKMPSEIEIDGVLNRVGSKYITLSPEKGFTFSRKGMQVDLGGIAKGYILDEMGEVLSANGVNKYVVSCGGDVIMQGKKYFRVGIQDPGGKDSKLMMVIKSLPGAVVTSGHYERYFEINGERYSHIIDPTNGRPVDNSLVSITIWGENGADADALATSVAVLGVQKSIDLLGKSDSFKAVLVAQENGAKKIYYSRSLAGKIEYVGKWADVPKVEF